MKILSVIPWHLREQLDISPKIGFAARMSPFGYERSSSQSNSCSGKGSGDFLAIGFP